MEETDVLLDSGGVKITGRLTVPDGASSLVVLVHGIPLSAPDPSDAGYALLAEKIAERGYASLVFNMRGTGDSGGDFHIAGWYEDIETVMSYVYAELYGRFDKVFMAGFSAGAALSIRYVAEHHGIDGLAAFAAVADFTALFPREDIFVFIEVAKDVGIIRHFDFPPSPDDFYRELEQNAAIDYVSRVSPVPLLLVHGEKDEMVPVEDAIELFEKAREPKELVLLTGGEHRLRHDERTLETLFDWLKGLGA